MDEQTETFFHREPSLAPEDYTEVKSVFSIKKLNDLEITS